MGRNFLGKVKPCEYQTLLPQSFIDRQGFKFEDVLLAAALQQQTFEKEIFIRFAFLRPRVERNHVLTWVKANSKF